MDFDKVVAKRASVSSYSPKRPSWKAAMLAIDAALQGPYAGNRNNLKFIIVEHLGRIERLAKIAEQSFIAQTKMVIVVLSDDKVLEEMYGERGRVYSRQQAGAAINSILLKLVDQGLAACWTGAYDDDEIRNLLKIPKNFQIEAIIPVGYAAEKGTKKKRKLTLDHVLHWDEYGMRRRPTLTEEHEVRELD